MVVFGVDEAGMLTVSDRKNVLVEVAKCWGIGDTIGEQVVSMLFFCFYFKRKKIGFYGLSVIEEVRDCC